MRMGCLLAGPFGWIYGVEVRSARSGLGFSFPRLLPSGLGLGLVIASFSTLWV
ncbi:hypothetical protein RchiOBHm_Chr1g0379251 [Rosa chinensis]|uniref:Uncharacterized protein n=1 Tax=Rosa chinensis TaxID=74649 RepID=A0A2P6SNL1_ROSCH|nr:hypothetical protein RchiOBHm_Chr1g0379251 [Rosa chinensis]